MWLLSCRVCPKARFALPVFTRVMWLTLLGLLGVLVTAVALYWRSLLAKALPGIPFVPPVFPSGNVGLVKACGGTILSTFEALAARLGPVYGFWLFGTQWIVVTHHEDAKTVLASSTYRTTFKALKVHNEAFLGPKAIVFLMNEEWRVHRSAMTKAFHLVDLKGMVTDFAGVGGRLCDYLASVAASGATIDFCTVIKAATLDAVGITSFGYDFGAVAGLYTGVQPPGVEEFQFLLHECSTRSYSGNPLGMLYWLPTAANRRHARSRTVLRDLIKNVVKTRRAQLAANPEGGHDDLLKYMLTEVNDEALEDNLLTLLFGGYDTTSLALSYAVWLLATNPGPLAKLRGEVDAHMPSSTADVNADVISNLKYARAVFEETLRMYPPAPLTLRTLTAPVTLSNGVELPAGTTVNIPISIIQRDPHNWPDEPNAFKPERFYAPLGQEGPRYPATAFLPFAFGRRDCVGRNFAMFEGTTLLAQLYRRFEFVPQPGYTLRAVHSGFVQIPEGGVPITVRERK